MCEILFCLHNAMVGQVRRYQAPDEHPFFPEGLPEPILPSLPLSKVQSELSILKHWQLRHGRFRDVLFGL
jgi:hypothetical protein